MEHRRSRIDIPLPSAGFRRNQGIGKLGVRIRCRRWANKSWLIVVGECDRRQRRDFGDLVVTKVGIL